MRKRYRLLKDTPELKAGAIVEEDCEDGTQGFTAIDRGFLVSERQKACAFTREVVIDQPDWFEEIIALYIPANKMKAVNKILGIKSS